MNPEDGPAGLAGIMLGDFVSVVLDGATRRGRIIAIQWSEKVGKVVTVSIETGAGKRAIDFLEDEITPTDGGAR